MKHIDRRFFLKSTAAGIAGTSLLSYLQFATCSAPGKAAVFMGGLTSMAILDDCADLAIRSSLVKKSVAYYLKSDIDQGLPANIARMGVLVHTNTEKAKGVIQRAKDEISHVYDGMSEQEIADAKKDRRSDAMKKQETIERKISLMLGWAMATGIREHVQPLYAQQQADGNLPSEMQVYHDIFVLKQKGALDGLDNSSVDEIANLFKGLNPRMIARTHTLTPDYDDGPGWTVRISQWRDDTMTLMDRYAEALVQPDAQKLRAYITDTNFYDPQDELIQLLNDANLDQQSLNDALKQTDASLYAQCLNRGVKALMEIAPIV